MFLRPPRDSPRTDEVPSQCETQKGAEPGRRVPKQKGIDGRRSRVIFPACCGEHERPSRLPIPKHARPPDLYLHRFANHEASSNRVLVGKENTTRSRRIADCLEQMRVAQFRALPAIFSRKPRHGSLFLPVESLVTRRGSSTPFRPAFALLELRSIGTMQPEELERADGANQSARSKNPRRWIVFSAARWQK